MSKEHLKIIDSCGIGHLQSLESLELYSGYIEHLLRRWDQKKEGFFFVSVFVKFSVKDVERISGLSNKGDVFDVTMRPYTSDWAKRCLHKERPDLHRLFSMLSQAVEGKSETAIMDACRMYILYMLGRVCFPLTNDLWPASICDLLEDVHKVKDWNWPVMLHRFLVQYINQTAPLAIERGNGLSVNGGNLCGAVWILQVWLYEHTNIWIGKPWNARQPRFKRWLGDNLKLSLMPGHIAKCSLLRAEVERVMHSIKDDKVRVLMEGVAHADTLQVCWMISNFVFCSH